MTDDASTARPARFVRPVGLLNGSNPTGGRHRSIGVLTRFAGVLAPGVGFDTPGPIPLSYLCPVRHPLVVGAFLGDERGGNRAATTTVRRSRTVYRFRAGRPGDRPGEDSRPDHTPGRPVRDVGWKDDPANRSTATARVVRADPSARSTSAASTAPGDTPVSTGATPTRATAPVTAAGSVPRVRAPAGLVSGFEPGHRLPNRVAVPPSLVFPAQTPVAAVLRGGERPGDAPAPGRFGSLRVLDTRSPFVPPEWRARVSSPDAGRRRRGRPGHDRRRAHPDEATVASGTAVPAPGGRVAPTPSAMSVRRTTAPAIPTTPTMYPTTAPEGSTAATNDGPAPAVPSPPASLTTLAVPGRDAGRPPRRAGGRVRSSGATARTASPRGSDPERRRGPTTVLREVAGTGRTAAVPVAPGSTLPDHPALTVLGGIDRATAAPTSDDGASQGGSPGPRPRARPRGTVDRPRMTVRQSGSVDARSAASEAGGTPRAGRNRPLAAAAEEGTRPAAQRQPAGGDVPGGVDVDRFADRLYRRFERKARVERERRGL